MGAIGRPIELRFCPLAIAAVAGCCSGEASLDRIKLSPLISFTDPPSTAAVAALLRQGFLVAFLDSTLASVPDAPSLRRTTIKLFWISSSSTSALPSPPQLRLQEARDELSISLSPVESSPLGRAENSSSLHQPSPRGVLPLGSKLLMSSWYPLLACCLSASMASPLPWRSPSPGILL
ncbi:unnamed protein product [Urochloa humidicola]